MNPKNCFTPFKSSIEDIKIPNKFTFPFYYDPHPIALLAASELQKRIETDIDWNHDFGLGQSISKLALGKMFGVLVVKNTTGELGYLSAFSGKLEGQNLDKIFVPYIYNRFSKKGHFFLETQQLDALNARIEAMETDPKLLAVKQQYLNKQKEISSILDIEKKQLKAASAERKSIRHTLQKQLSEEDYKQLHAAHKQQSINDTFYYKEYSAYLDSKLQKAKLEVQDMEQSIERLREQRKSTSIKLQHWLFDQYNFLNAKGEIKNVQTLFKTRIPNVPPSGSGDCAAPKLLQYAFQHQLKPIALAEFWWGKEPSSKVRKHKYFYPACRGKCEPILDFMMEGLNVDENPLLKNPGIGKKIKIVYEDEHLVVINKPAEFLSVPGKHVVDSVQERMLQRYPQATGPMIVHRLDMSTSGLMLIAKSKSVHKNLQQAFKHRSIKKRYVALLDGQVEGESGFIDLPLRLDIENRPFQMVCYKHGKACRTKWELVERKDNFTKVYFYPLSGRTHQLRMHAAHRDGLAAPIVGDDLYGLKKDRLYLHAESLSLEHPVTGQALEVRAEAEF